MYVGLIDSSYTITIFNYNKLHMNLNVLLLKHPINTLPVEQAYTHDARDSLKGTKQDMEI